VQPRDGVPQQRAAGDLGDQVVELRVQRGEGGVSAIAVAGLHVDARRRLDADPLAGFGGGVRGGPSGGGALQQLADVEQVVELGTAQQRRGGVAGEWAFTDQAVGLQPGEGLADRGGGDVQFPGERVDVDPLAGGKDVVHDQRLYRLVDVLGEGESTGGTESTLARFLLGHLVSSATP
jgi:hypothetical protein